MSEQQKKHKILRTVKEGDMIKVDERTFQTKKYMIYNSESKGWLCDCLDFIFGNKNCKHIKRAKEL